MTATFTNAGRQALLTAIGKDIKDNPFVQDGKIYCKFDSISIKNKSWLKSGLDVFFCWKGVEIMVIESNDRPNFQYGDTLTITGIEGRLEVVLGD